MATSSEIIAGLGGFEVVANTNAVTGKEYNSIVINEDAVFTSFSINGTNVLSSKGMSSVTIKQGMFLSAGGTNKITGFQLTSGSVIAYS